MPWNPPPVPVLGDPATFRERIGPYLTWFAELNAADFFPVQSSPTDATPNRVMKVGAFGLGADRAIYVTDLNAITEVGFYRIGSGDASAGNAPLISSSFYVYHTAYDSNSASQIAVRAASTHGVYVRTKVAGTWTAWTEIYHKSNILGTVSQSAGVPTGAVIESGGNANGRYRRFACGMQECWRDDLSVADINTAIGASGLYRSTAAITWTFPAAFLAGSNPTVTGQGSQVSQWLAPGGAGATSVNLNAISYAQQATAQTVRPRAVGRWF